MTQDQVSGGGFYASSWLAIQWLKVVVQIVHVLIAIVLVGVPFVVRALVIPDVDDKTTADIVGSFYSTWPLVVAVILFTTGFLNFLFENAGSNNSFIGSFFTQYGVTVLIKISLLVVIDVISILLGISDAFQADAETWLTVLMVIGIIAVVIGGTLHRGSLKIESDS